MAVDTTLGTTSLASLTALPTSTGKKHNATGAVVGGVVGGIGALTLLAFIAILLCRRRRRRMFQDSSINSTSNRRLEIDPFVPPSLEPQTSELPSQTGFLGSTTKVHDTRTLPTSSAFFHQSTPLASSPGSSSRPSSSQQALPRGTASSSFNQAAGVLLRGDSADAPPPYREAPK
jgi:hypothetical protein